MAEERSLLEHAVLRAGVFKGSTGARVVVMWAIAVRELGHELGQGEGVTAAVREYIDFWKISERGGWRALKRFHAVFPEHETPAPLATTLLQLVDAREHLGPGADLERAMTQLRFAA